MEKIFKNDELAQVQQIDGPPIGQCVAMHIPAIHIIDNYDGSLRFDIHEIVAATFGDCGVVTIHEDFMTSDTVFLWSESD
ncbi:MAG: hypothetical protein GY771_07190 [bacterium]|nr:hypothetical protein [bacterium]